MLTRTSLSALFTLIFSSLLSQISYGYTVSDSIILYTPYTKITVPPGQSVSYSVDLINNSKRMINADISLKGLSSSWIYDLKAGEYRIRQLSVLPAERKSIYLTVEVPLKVNKGSYQFELVAGDYSVLPLTLVVSEQGTFRTEFTTNQGNMQGNATSLFTFQTALKNLTAEKQTYALMADGPRGWSIVFKYNYKQVTSAEVNPNTTADITIEVDPPDIVEAGTYRIPVIATTNGTTYNLVLEAVVTGSYSMELTTPSGLLSADITAGDQKRIELAVRNTGTTELKDIQFSASAPVNWEVTFDPKKIELLEAGKTGQAFVNIKAAKKAITGDYVTNLEARTPEVSSRATFRMSVKTPMVWGWVGILVIAITLGGVYYLFRRYGRR